LPNHEPGWRDRRGPFDLAKGEPFPLFHHKFGALMLGSVNPRYRLWVTDITSSFTLSGRSVQAEKIDEPEWLAGWVRPKGLRRNQRSDDSG